MSELRRSKRLKLTRDIGNSWKISVHTEKAGLAKLEAWRVYDRTFRPNQPESKAYSIPELLPQHRSN